MSLTKYGEKSFNGSEVFSYGDLKVLHDPGHESYKLQWKNIIIPEIGAEDGIHLDCLGRALELTLLVAGIETQDVMKGLARFKISNFTFTQKEVKVKWL